MGTRAVLAVLVVSGCAAPALRPSAVLPSVPVLAAADAPTDLRAVAGGRPMVVDFFASWCDACRDNLPRMNDLARDHASGDVVVVGVDVGEERRVAERFAARAGIRYPVYLDPELRLQDSLGVTALPLVLVVDAQGNIAHRSAALDEETLAVIRRLAADGAEGAR